MPSKSPEPQSVDLDEVAYQSAPKEDIAYRIEEAQRLRKAQSIIAQKRQSKLRLVTIFIIICLAGASYWGYLFYNRPKPITPDPPPTNSEFTIRMGEVKVWDNYTVRKATVTTPNNGVLDVVAYDFDSNRFLKGKVILDNQDALKKIFVELREELEKSWILIFAGASIEGNSSRNLALCRQRVNAVGQMMKNEIGIKGLGYWAIRAGEYKGKEASLSDDEEDVIAKKLGETGLADQRRLIVIATIPQQSQPQSSFDSIVSRLVKSFYDHEFLPINYDHSRTEPTSLNGPRQ